MYRHQPDELGLDLLDGVLGDLVGRRDLVGELLLVLDAAAAAAAALLARNLVLDEHLVELAVPLALRPQARRQRVALRLHERRRGFAA